MSQMGEKNFEVRIPQIVRIFGFDIRNKYGNLTATAATGGVRNVSATKYDMVATKHDLSTIHVNCC